MTAPDDSLRAAPGLGESGAGEPIGQIVALMLQSVELDHQRRWVDALACLDEAIAIDPSLPLCYVNRARVLAKLDRYEDALDAYDFVLSHSSDSSDSSDPSQIVVWRQELLDAALTVLDRRLAGRPGDLAAHLQRGNLLRKTLRYDLALADYAAILCRDAGHADALNHQGGVFFARHQLPAALASYTRATAAAPQRAELWYNLGNVHQALGGLDQARAAYRQAVALAPQFAEAQLEIGLLDLSQGNYRAGWPQFEWRWRTAQMKDRRLPTAQALWLGGSDDSLLAGKTLLVWAEQGAGDTLQFVRFVPRLLGRAGRVIVRVQAPLRRLVERLDQRLTVVGDDQPLPAHDFHLPLLSLPLALGVGEAQDVADAAATPYLDADAAQVARWRDRLGAATRLRVGIAWAGRRSGLANPTRDIPPALLRPLAERAVELISLQVPPADAQTLGDLPGLRCFAAELVDYADTAALIMSLDLVIAVDTAVAHLAGALGKPCWLLLRQAGEWRWLRQRSDSPWYPRMTIFRQATPGDWGELVARVADALPAASDR
jgi:tetratricopeptide (TPR) repeat protein